VALVVSLSFPSATHQKTAFSILRENNSTAASRKRSLEQRLSLIQLAEIAIVVGRDTVNGWEHVGERTATPASQLNAWSVQSPSGKA